MNSKLRGRGLGIAGALLTLLAGSVHAEGPAIGGYVDTQYIYNWNQPITGTNNLRSYDSKDNTISNTVHLALTGKLSDETNYVVELDGGNDAPTTVGAASTGSDIFLQEAYLNWVGASKFGIKAGKFVTYEGIEVIENVANPTITRGFLFGLAEPFTHVGAVATYAVDKLDFALGVVNGWDQPTDVNTDKTWVAKVGLNLGDPLALTLSGYYGAERANSARVLPTLDDPLTPLVDESSAGSIGSTQGDKRTSIDLTGVTKIIPKTDLNFQLNWGSEDNTQFSTGDGQNDTWGGFGIQPVVHVSDKFFVGGRYEYFADGNGSRVGGVNDFSAYNISVAPGYKINDNVVVRLEYRVDTANKKVFVDDKGTAKDTNSTTSAQVAVTF